ncbi:restriction endonuclease subunit S [Rhodococcus sp. 24CO]|uniref:restriction endonuclease subunit S n=1 Tax=Rhodococcus sp. 24CO TaxID=3117460 RepID=UPI003D32DF47
MSTWPMVALGDMAEFINGVAFKPDDWSATGRRIVRIQNLNDPTKSYNRTEREVAGKYHVGRGDLLVSWSASLGVYEWREPDIAVVNQHIFRVVPFPEVVDKGYLRHGLVMALGSMEGHLHGATMKHVNRGQFLATEILLPPLSEQRRIAAILDHVDALRARRRAALAQLEELTQAIFVDMFGEPTTNPEGWDIVRLSELVRDGDKINYGVVQPGEESEGGVPLIRAGDLDGGQFDIQRLRTVAPEVDVRHRRSRLVGDEILVSCVGSIGVVALASVREKGFNIARAVARIRVGERVHRIFLATYLSTPAVRNYFTSELRTVAQPTLNIKQLEATEVPLPPMAAQEVFVRRILGVDQLRYQQQTAQDELNMLFGALQSRAFRGEL